MTTIYSKLPDISEVNEFIQTIPIESNTTIVVIFKQLFRSEDVLVDIYLNEISEDSKIISGVTLVENTLVSLPKPNIGFNFYINCEDSDGVSLPLKNNNVHKFYFMISNGETWDWT